MNRIRKGCLAVFTVAACFMLALPVISSADDVVLMDKYFGPGTYYDEPIVISHFVPRDLDMGRTRIPFRLIKGISITVENGTEEGKHRVASAQVFLNGEEIFDQNDFNNHYTRITESRYYHELPPRMELDVKVNGSKKSQLRVMVKGIYH